MRASRAQARSIAPDVLVLSAVGSISQLEDIRTGMQDVLRVAEFNEGHRYSDFDASSDRIATYGLGALIAGGIASKAGLFAKLGAILLASKKLLGVAVIALIGFVGKLFGRKRSDTSAGH